MEVSPVPSAQPRRFRWWILAAVIGGVIISLMFCAIVSVGALSLLGRKVTPPAVITATDGQSQLSVPAGWSKHDDLHDDAELQVANPVLEQYMIVLTENKADFVDTDLEDYTEIVLESVVATAGGEEPEPTSLTINGRPAVQYEVHGTVDNMKVVYWLTTVEGTENYYQVLGWTLDSKAEENRPVLQEVVQSFQEVVK